jgi:hypothetical protein
MKPHRDDARSSSRTWTNCTGQSVAQRNCRIGCSGNPTGRVNLDHPAQLAWLYETVLREAATADELRAWLDGPTLVRIWADLSFLAAFAKPGRSVTRCSEPRQPHDAHRRTVSDQGCAARASRRPVRRGSLVPSSTRSHRRGGQYRLGERGDPEQALVASVPCYRRRSNRCCRRAVAAIPMTLRTMNMHSLIASVLSAAPVRKSLRSRVVGDSPYVGAVMLRCRFRRVCG